MMVTAVHSGYCLTVGISGYDYAKRIAIAQIKVYEGGGLVENSVVLSR